MLRFGDLGAPFLVPLGAMSGIFLDLKIIREPQSDGNDPLLRPAGGAICSRPRWNATCAQLTHTLLNSTVERRERSVRLCFARARGRRGHGRGGQRGARRTLRGAAARGRALEQASRGGSSSSASDGAAGVCTRSAPSTARIATWASQAAETIVRHAHLVRRTVEEAGCAALTKQALKRLGSLSHVLFSDVAKLSLDHAQQMAHAHEADAGGGGGAGSSRSGQGPLPHSNRAVRVRAGLFDEREVAPFNSCAQQVYGAVFAALSTAASRFEALAELDSPSARMDTQLDRMAS